MNCSIVLDWKFVLALGVSAGIIICAVKLGEKAAEEVLKHGFSTGKELALAYNSGR